jgi:hypothetical protein
MRHCHFSIMWNEMPFLKQKLPFLYQHFDQIIFFDLNIKTKMQSDDGGREFILNFPDPSCKIIYIQDINLDDVEIFEGQSFEEKCKMFAVGSSLVNEDINVFWCTDMDEFFERTLIEKVENVLRTTDTMTIIVPHIIYWWDERFIFAGNNGEDTHPFPFARITRHVPGRIYGHCTLQKYTPVIILNEELLYHFAFVGNKRVKFKSNIYNQNIWYEDVWKKFNPDTIPDTGIVGKYHPGLDIGIKRSQYTLPSYINIKELITDLNSE